jgi:hypothetical protein
MRSTGMIGMTRGQTMRLNVVNLARTVEGQLPPPCRVVRNGQPAVNANCHREQPREMTTMNGPDPVVFSSPPTTPGGTMRNLAVPTAAFLLLLSVALGVNNLRMSVPSISIRVNGEGSCRELSRPFQGL